MNRIIGILLAALALSVSISGCRYHGQSVPAASSVVSRAVTIAELPTFERTESRYRRLRNAAFESLGPNPAPGNYTLAVPPSAVAITNGWQVSFQTTIGEGLTGCPMADADYDNTVEELSRETGSVPYLGVFGGIPEISFFCETKELALDIAARYHQSCVADNARIASGKTDGLSFPRNPSCDCRKNPLVVAE